MKKTKFRAFSGDSSMEKYFSDSVQDYIDKSQEYGFVVDYKTVDVTDHSGLPYARIIVTVWMTKGEF